MKFEEALQAMREGKKVTRKHLAIVLGEPVHYCILNGKLIYYSGIEYYDFPLSTEDILSEDWELVK